MKRVKQLLLSAVRFCFRISTAFICLLPLHPPTSFPSSFTNNNQSSVSGAASISVPTIPVSASLPSVSAGHGSSAATSGGFNELRSTNGSRKARVLYDYDAASSNELSLLADEVSLRQLLVHRMSVVS